MRRRIRRYARLFGHARRLLITSLLVSLLQSALLIPIPLVIKHVFDVDLRRPHAGAMVLQGAIVLCLYLASAGLGLWTRYAVLDATKRSIAVLRGGLLKKLYELPRAFHDRHDAGELHATIVQDSERLDMIANAVVGLMLPAAIVAAGLAAVALAFNPLLFAVLACALPPMVLLSRAMSHRLRARTRRWQTAFDLFSAQTQLALRTRTLAEVRAAEELELGARRKQVGDLSTAGLQMAWRQSAWGIGQGAIVAAAGVVVLVVGGIGVAHHEMTVGQLLSFYAIVALLQAQVSTVVSLLPLVVSGEESLRRLDVILDADQPMPYAGRRRIDFSGSITLSAVTFGYGSEPLLEDVELELEAGEQVVVVGPNGAGKSTLASLILGLYRPWSGRLLADGVPYDELDMRHLRRAFGVVLQDPVIIPASAAENIAYGRPEATPADIRRAAELAGAAAFIERLPRGYDTWVGDEGSLLSGGERQRLAIARALISSPRLLILDEPTTHLDDEAIATVQANLDALPGAPGVLTITHDEAIARAAARVIYIRDGRLRGVGGLATGPARVARA
jgi:ABC-type bacteriocin/lantibiotic exporter with double-glycine peptidase domain